MTVRKCQTTYVLMGKSSMRMPNKLGEKSVESDLLVPFVLELHEILRLLNSERTRGRSNDSVS